MSKIAPWPFVEGVSAPIPGCIPNEPSELGAELGREIARLCDHEYATTGRDSRCATCAFRLGTIPNQCAATLMNALKCSLEGERFSCHETDRPCGGWVAFMQAKGTSEVKTIDREPLTEADLHAIIANAVEQEQRSADVGFYLHVSFPVTPEDAQAIRSERLLRRFTFDAGGLPYRAVFDDVVDGVAFYEVEDWR